MRPVLAFLFCLTIVALSCKKETSPVAGSISQNTFAGTFQRQTSTGGQISNVTINFSANKWSGQSQFPKYPALCQGTYEAKGTDSITFINSCPWTAEFDWTLILSGDYKITVAGNNLEISREYNATSKDIYKLTKQ